MNPFSIDMQIVFHEKLTFFFHFIFQLDCIFFQLFIFLLFQLFIVHWTKKKKTQKEYGNKYYYLLFVCKQLRKRRRCRALYDCNADNDDELEFKENEIIIVLNERTDDENWMYGEIEGTSRRGMFPVSFVQMLSE